MRKEYGFSKSRSNSFSARVTKRITIQVDEESIDYFNGISEEVGIPFQSSSTCTCATVRHCTGS